MKPIRYTRTRFFFACLLGAISALGMPELGWGAPEGPVMAGTSMTAAVLEALLPDAAPVRSMIPGAMCPGHYDLRPSDIEALAKCSCLVLQAWQRQMSNVRKAVQAAGLPEARIRVVEAPGSWMTPEGYTGALVATAKTLSGVMPEQAERLSLRVAMQREAAIKTGETLAARFRRLEAERVNVLCNEMQSELLRSFGFTIAGTFARGEDLSVGEIERLIAAARSSGVALVVENLQSGTPAVSQSLAKECGAGHVVLTNFPGGFEGTETWERTIERNAALLEEAVLTWRRAHE